MRAGSATSTKKVKEFGVYAVYNYSGVDGDGITSSAASEDLERVVKVIDIALEYANDNYEADVLGTRRLDHAEDEATEAAQRQPDLHGTRSEARQAG